MDKKLKELIKAKGLTDDALIALITNNHQDSDNQSESEDSDNAEEQPANEEDATENRVMSMDDFNKLVDQRVAKLMKNEKPIGKSPAKKVKGGFILDQHGFIPM